MDLMFALSVGPERGSGRGRKPQPTCRWCIVVLVVALCIGFGLAWAIAIGDHRP